MIQLPMIWESRSRSNSKEPPKLGFIVLSWSTNLSLFNQSSHKVMRMEDGRFSEVMNQVVQSNCSLSLCQIANCTCPQSSHFTLSFSTFAVSLTLSGPLLFKIFFTKMFTKIFSKIIHTILSFMFHTFFIVVDFFLAPLDFFTNVF